jgi:hypothetical protein
LVGWLSQLGLKTILPIVTLVGIRFWSLETENQSLWLEQPDDTTHPVWYALQASIFVGSVCAGALAAMLSPRKALMAPFALVILSLLATSFEQFPRPLPNTALLVWAVGPCIGLVLGWVVVRVLARRDA